MQGRSGPFWDGVEERAPIPPAAATLGFELIDADVEAGRARPQPPSEPVPGRPGLAESAPPG